MWDAMSEWFRIVGSRYPWFLALCCASCASALIRLLLVRRNSRSATVAGQAVLTLASVCVAATVGVVSEMRSQLVEFANGAIAAAEAHRAAEQQLAILGIGLSSIGFSSMSILFVAVVRVASQQPRRPETIIPLGASILILVVLLLICLPYLGSVGEAIACRAPGPINNTLIRQHSRFTEARIGICGAALLILVFQTLTARPNAGSKLSARISLFYIMAALFCIKATTPLRRDAATPLRSAVGVCVVAENTPRDRFIPRVSACHMLPEHSPDIHIDLTSSPPSLYRRGIFAGPMAAPDDLVLRLRDHLPLAHRDRRVNDFGLIVPMPAASSQLDRWMDAAARGGAKTCAVAALARITRRTETVGLLARESRCWVALEQCTGEAARTRLAALTSGSP